MVRILLILSFLFITGGCSTLMSKPEARELWPTLEYTSCTESKVAPTLDAIGGGWEVGAGLVQLALGSPIAFIDLLIGGVLIWSSVEGSSNAEDCRALKNHIASGGGGTKRTKGEHEEVQLERQKLEYEKMKFELEKEKLELQKAREQIRK
jgi:hypothetical protein